MLPSHTGPPSWTGKKRIVDETGRASSAVARRCRLHPGQVFAWRKAAGRETSRVHRSGSLDCAFAPVLVTSGSYIQPSGAVDCGRIEIAAQQPPYCG
jgi:hypothetical protein